jgi:hypothetical protein
VTWVRRYVGYEGPQPAYLPSDFTKRPLDWTIGGLTPAMTFFSNMQLAASLGIPLGQALPAGEHSRRAGRSYRPQRLALPGLTVADAKVGITRELLRLKIIRLESRYPGFTGGSLPVLSGSDMPFKRTSATLSAYSRTWFSSCEASWGAISETRPIWPKGADPPEVSWK